MAGSFASLDDCTHLLRNPHVLDLLRYPGVERYSSHCLAWLLL